jgi:hypothetical protein
VRGGKALDCKGSRKPSGRTSESCTQETRKQNVEVEADCMQENVTGITWVKNYKFDFRFQQWGQCAVTFTCVAGHIVAQDFGERFRKWHSCQPVALFDAPIESSIADVRCR